jgi:hypothetical protein
MRPKNSALVPSPWPLPGGMTRGEFFAKTFGALTAMALGRPSLKAQRGAVTDASLGAIGEPAGWSRFRGPNGDGQMRGGRYPIIGPSTRAWMQKIAMGKSSPVLTPKHIFMTAQRDTTPLVICLDKSTGEPLWEQAVQTPRREPRHTLNALSAPTQATDGENIYSFFTDMGLISHDPSGRRLWEVPIPRRPRASGVPLPRPSSWETTSCSRSTATTTPTSPHSTERRERSVGGRRDRRKARATPPQSSGPLTMG